MKTALIPCLALGALFLLMSCGPKKHPPATYHPQANAQARLLSLNVTIDSLEALPEPSSTQLDSLRKLRALEQNNLELMGKAQGTQPAEDPQELYKANEAKAKEDRSLGRKPEFLIP